ncbi:MAG: ATP-dependent RNA helicase RhlB [Halofilum sp. (in: g-proteobacteria)]|nr:ATP-dependent RNA helicase RhlB [Halofilum sp. (in: g-proteobacteria)]
MTKTDHHLSDLPFSQFDLPEPVARGLADAGFERCTPIQAETLPLMLAGRDVAGQAQTGTGKTAAFLVAAFTHLLRNPAPEDRKPTQPRAFMVAPTRELAIQIHKDAVALGAHTDFRIGLAYGGTDYDKQRQTIADGVDILIGTPGRLIDYLKQGVYDLKQVQVAVLDEADRMFDLGFIADIRYLFRRMPDPDKRLSMLFSATLSLRVCELAFEHMNHPEHVESQPEQVTAEKVEQILYHPANEEKIPLLVGLLRDLEDPRAMVFVNTKRGCERVWRYLKGNGIEAAVLSGDVHQRKRQRLLGEFQAGKLPVLIATDVAARGLHIPGVTHVFNFDLPQNAEDYVHRIGRTARAGESGHAVSFACEDTAFSVPDIEQYIGNKIPTAGVHSGLLADLQPPSKEKLTGQTRQAERERERRGGKGRGQGAGNRSGGGSGGGGSGGGSSGGGGDGSGRKRRRRRRKPGQAVAGQSS